MQIQIHNYKYKSILSITRQRMSTADFLGLAAPSDTLNIYKYTNTQIKIQIHKHKYTNTNTKVHSPSHQATDADSRFSRPRRSV